MNENERQSRILTVALELLRRQFRDSMAFIFANRERKESSPWTKVIMDAAAPQPQHHIPDAPDSTGSATKPPNQRPHSAPVVPPSTPPAYEVVNPLPPAPGPRPADSYGPNEVPKTIPAGMGGFGLGAPQTSKTPAFDRPQPVIIVGPNPLPVRFDKAFAMSPTTPREKRDPKEGVNIAAELASRFAVVLGPLYALSTILGQTNSGFGVFLKAVSLVGSTLAPILLPVFATLAAALIVLSEYIWEAMIPALKEFYGWLRKQGGNAEEFGKVVAAGAAVWGGSKLLGSAGGMGGIAAGLWGAIKGIGKAIPAVAVADSAIGAVTGDYYAKARGEGANKFMSGMYALGGGTIDMFSSAGKLVGLNDKTFGEKFSEDPENQKHIRKFRGQPEPKPGSPGAPESKERSFGTRFNEAMRDVIRSIGLSMGPKGSYSALTEVGRNVTLAAINVDPIEARQLKIMQDTFSLLQQEFAKSDTAANPSPAIYQPKTMMGGLPRRPF